MSDTMFARKLLRAGVRMFAVVAVASIVASATPALAAVAIFDGFGDADRDNDGTPLEVADVDASGSGNGTVGPYVAAANGGTPMVFPMDTMVDEVTAVENASDVGIRWYSIGGWSGGTTPAPRAAVSIISDAAGHLPETNPAIGFYHSVPAQTLYSEAIDDGLALSFDSKGRGNPAAGFFNETVELGDEVDDEVRVSFDFRIWYSGANFNPDTNINHIPAFGEIRFGLYEDSDNQLGQTNTIAGLGSTPAAWGQENGNFRGDSGTVGANGDKGWFVRLPIDDSHNTTTNQQTSDFIGRINEEANPSSGGDGRILNGTTDFVAGAEASFVQMDINKVYNLSLSLKRFDDPATEGNAGDTIFATTTVTERSSGMQWSFGNYERVINATTMVPDGISSDAWDYFVMSTAGSSTSDDFEWLIDNFTVEQFGSNAVEPGLDGDFNNDGVVDAVDYTVWRNNFGDLDETNINNNGDGGDVGPGDYTLWKSSYGNMAPGSGGLGSYAVPEPVSAAMLLPLIVAGLMRASRVRR
jgi:hypothetical protein